MSEPLDLALHLAALGRHVFPLSPHSKRPLSNCPHCRPASGRPGHRIDTCPCLAAGAWCHGVRAATTDPQRITRWWTAAPRAAVALAAGPSGLILIDIDTHTDTPPQHPGTALLPGIDLRTEPAAAGWREQDYRDGRDTLTLLARLRGGPHPWPTDPAHRPVTADTPSGGRHLWYQAPAPDLHQAVPPKPLAWQVDVKAGWSYGLAPGTRTAAGHYTHRSGDLAKPGRLPDWLAREIIRACQPTPPPQRAPHYRPVIASGGGPANYLRTVLDNGAEHLARLEDGRKTVLSALAYKAGGYLAHSGLSETEVIDQLITAGTNSGLTHREAERTARRALDNGKTRPLTPTQQHR
ncbi:MAG TPA: bifunctional DNA primase/polymerase [Actinocrinis sp.]|uniref:bifunctional DNA primase/polymerase n=1 Tax=Actinocrinis sp. TaxID=1920516 RepID=UPI002DDC95E7|nr:bifunctional DNA primase/polymerase [Actinocrinis sp.]HEV2343439.1 bifunctional DNA primase/polymerase [Actinocrinis sp.]